MKRVGWNTATPDGLLQRWAPDLLVQWQRVCPCTRCLWRWQIGYLVSFWKHRRFLMMANSPVMAIYSLFGTDNWFCLGEKKKGRYQYFSETQVVTSVPRDRWHWLPLSLPPRGLILVWSSGFVAPHPPNTNQQANRSIMQRFNTGFPVPLCDRPSGRRLLFQHRSLVCSALSVPAEPANQAASATGDLWGRHMPAAE